jgi:nucleotide-binding universal stress UspA family protein
LRERHRHLGVEDQGVLGGGVVEGVPGEEVEDLRDEREADAVVVL